MKWINENLRMKYFILSVRILKKNELVLLIFIALDLFNPPNLVWIYPSFYQSSKEPLSWTIKNTFDYFHNGNKHSKLPKWRQRGSKFWPNAIKYSPTLKKVWLGLFCVNSKEHGFLRFSLTDWKVSQKETYEVILGRHFF